MSTLRTTTAANLTSLGATSNIGDAYFETDNKKIVVWDGSAWTAYNNDGVSAPYSNAYSVDFDGSNDIAIASPNIAHSSVSAYTISAFANFDSFGSGRGPYTILGGTSVTDWTYNTLCRVDSSTSMTIYHRGTSNYSGFTVPSVSLSTGTWHHFLQVWTGSHVKFYIDGVEKLNTSSSNTTSYAGRSGYDIRFYVGNGRGGYHDGKVDEFAWWDSDQSANIGDIRDSVTGGAKDLSQMTTQPTHWYRMGDDDGGTGTTITDQGIASTTYDMTLTNGAAIVSSAP